MRNPRNYSNDIIFEVAWRFMRGERVARIQAWLVSAGIEHVNRETVYRLVRQAADKNFIQLRAPEELELGRQLRQRFPNVGDINVLNIDINRRDPPEAFPDPERLRMTLTFIADRAAQDAIELIKDIGQRQERVHIGMGAGYSTQHFAQALAQRLEFARDLPALSLHAITSGFSVDDPNRAPISFFSYFQGLSESRCFKKGINPVQGIAFKGLFAPAVVASAAYEDIKQAPGVKEAFDYAGQLDIVITSLSDAQDEDGMYGGILTFADKNKVNELWKAGWVGDIQWRPYSKQGPIEVDTGVRIVTLFELEQLVEFSHQPGKHVICLAAPCGKCGRSRANALRPLLEVTSLRAFNHLYTDTSTGRILIDPKKASAIPL